ncbi:hypothetical protein ACVWYG_001894 [Pedobacter sp. UYEF25]
MANSNLTKAKSVKNDEFYTQYQDIEKEIMAYLDFNLNAFKDKIVLLPCDDPEWSNFTKFFAQNFERLKLKKLISTSYAPDSKKLKIIYAPTLFETNAPQFDKTKTILNGKIFTLDHDTSGDGKIDVNDLEWTYLKGDGDFKSAEIRKLRDEADIIITNPPFSLFREFLSWIIEADKQFVVIGSMNAITYRDVFAIIKNNKMWLGSGFKSGNAYFSSPISNEYAEGVFDKETGLVKFRNCCWFTNIDHGRRHQILPLMTMQDNIKFSKHKELKGKEYDKYENFNAIDVSFTDAIPSDYNGAMGVPISFLDKYSPDQFEIIGLGISNSGIECGVKPYKLEHKKYRKEIQKRGAVDGDLYMIKDEIVVVPYARILIRRKK